MRLAPVTTARMPSRVAAPLLVPRSLATQLMQLYDVSDTRKPGRVIRGYDRPHARRTARLCAAVASRLGHPEPRVRNYQIACLLHDLGRAGLDPKLFGTIWSWARKEGIPTRPREWRALYPDTPDGLETDAFLKRYGMALAKLGIPLDSWTVRQIDMRLGYARSLSRRLRAVRPRLREMGVTWAPWMGRIMLYYYYPEKLNGSPAWVRELAEVLVACEQFEAFSNRRRGQDYYRRAKETLSDAFAYLDKLRVEGMLSARVVATVRDLAAEGAFDGILAEARGAALPPREIRYLRGLKTASTRVV